MKKLVSKDLIFSLYENCIFNSINNPITKEQVTFRIIKHIIYSITNNRIALGKLNDKKNLDNDVITTYFLGSNIPFIKYLNDEDIPNSIEELKKKIFKIINFDDVTVKNIKEHLNWSQIPDYPYRVLIIRGSGSWKKNALRNLFYMLFMC